MAASGGTNAGAAAVAPGLGQAPATWSRAGASHSPVKRQYCAVGYYPWTPGARAHRLYATLASCRPRYGSGGESGLRGRRAGPPAGGGPVRAAPTLGHAWLVASAAAPGGPRLALAGLQLLRPPAH